MMPKAMATREDQGTAFEVAREDAGQALAAYLRVRLPGKSWNDIKRMVATGKIFVDGVRQLGPELRVRAGMLVELRMAAPRPREAKSEVRIVFEDAHVVVIDKPAGVSSVPYEARETGTALDLVRDAWRRMGRAATQQALFVVHRIDKETSGLLMYGKSKQAERVLGAQFRAHEVKRLYLCVACGKVESARIQSQLVADRGDGLRGSARHAGQGKLAVTHVKAVKNLRGATLCEVRLETGKTHQIRIHLSERGHPLVGEKVYVRDFLARDGVMPASPRLLLHAATLGFAHPTTGVSLSFESPLPEDFTRALARLA
jgi:23S rRNA pseudouridine1911/1915/1917 synthase